VTPAVQVAREKGKSAYVGDGSSRWSAVHVSDVARLYRLAFEKAEPGAIYHAVGEEGVSLKAIAEAIGRGLKLPVTSIKPEEAEAHFGSLGMFTGLDLSASSANTQKKLNWKPAGPGLIADLDEMDYAQKNMSRVFITGSSDGLGLMSARLLVEQGLSVVLHARNAQRAEKTHRKHH
jgi:hypothetical protein